MSKNSDDKFSNDEFGVEGPAWADGKIINEAIFCEEFLSKHKIIFSGGSFFTAEGRVVDEIPLKRMVFDDLKVCAVANVPQKISNIVELLKIQALDETFAPETDRIHLEDGTLYFNGCFVDIKESVVRTRLPVRYNPYAPNCDDMNAKTPDGELAERILDEYYQDFQKRNPYLRVFSAHLHMDEATPHLHIDFIPFTTNSKRGLDTRVSLKQALCNQGFIGKSKHETEWSLWVESEKAELAKVMERYGVEWEQKGTHEKHLSVYDYEKKMRSQEVEKLTAESEKLNLKVEELTEKAETLMQFNSDMSEIAEDFYDTDEFKLPEPPPLMTAKAYKTKFVEPLFRKLLDLAKIAVRKCFELQNQLNSIKLWGKADKVNAGQILAENRTLTEQNERLNRDVQNYKLLRKIFGDEQIDALVVKAKETERVNRQARYRKPNTPIRKTDR